MNKQEIEKAIERLKRMLFNNDSKQACDALNLAIAALEQQLTNRWIPVMERLPEYSGEYEATVKTLLGYDGIMPDIVQNIRMVYVIGKWKNQWFQEIPYYEVLAWKELSEPYKEVSE